MTIEKGAEDTAPEAEQTNTQGTPQTQEMVPLTEASDDDIDAFLGSPDAEGETLSDPDEVTEEEDEIIEDDEPEANTQEAAEATEAEEPEPKAAPLTESELREQYERAQEQIAAKDAHIQRQAAELGVLRKNKLAQYEELEKSLDDAFIESPKKALALKEKLDTLKGEIEDIDHNQRTIINRHNNLKVVSRHIPPNAVHIDELTKVLADDGVPADIIAEFRRDPYGRSDALTLINLSKRVIAERALARERAERTKTAKALEAAKRKPDQIIKGIERASRGRAPVSRSNKSGQRPGKGLSPVELSQVSDTELDEILRN